LNENVGKLERTQFPTGGLQVIAIITEFAELFRNVRGITGVMLMFVIKERQSGSSNHPDCRGVAGTKLSPTNEFAAGYFTPEMSKCGDTPVSFASLRRFELLTDG